MNKKTLKMVLLSVSVVFHIIGIMSLLQVNKINVGLGFFYNLFNHLILQYVFVVVFMSIAIMTLSVFAGQLDGKLKNRLSIGVCTYSTILTIPLFLTFVGCFFYPSGIVLPLVGDIAKDLMSIFTSPAAYYIVFTLGTIMGIIFLAVPILTTISTVKGVSLKELFIKKEKKS